MKTSNLVLTSKDSKSTVLDLSRKLMTKARMRKNNYSLGARQRISKENDLQLKF